MESSKKPACALGVMAVAVLFAGCNGGTHASALAPTGITNAQRGGASPLNHNAAGAFITARQPGKVHPDRRKSWISPDAKRAPRLAFYSDSGNEDVYIYSLPKLTLKGVLTGFSEPQGMCSDTSGNVYVANTGSDQVYKLSRAGSIIATYTDPDGYPVGCAYDPASGNLAITDIFGFYGQGQVLVYKSPSSTPVVLTNPSQYFYYFAGYGPNSVLWVSGRSSSGDYMVSACGASSCNTVTLSGGTIYFPGAVQWDGVRSNWVLFDQLCGDTEAACSYPVSDSGVLGNPTYYLNYDGSNVCDMVQGAIGGNKLGFVIGGDYEYCGSASNSVDRWLYPAGGNPTNSGTLNSYAIAGGAAVSSK